MDDPWADPLATYKPKNLSIDESVFTKVNEPETRQSETITNDTTKNSGTNNIQPLSSTSPREKYITTPSRIPTEPIRPVLAVLLVDFNHVLGPVVEFSYPPEYANDHTISTLLPFLALPDGSHLQDEDYSYFHICPTSDLPGVEHAATKTLFGISCNRQLATSDLKVKESSVKRSTVQKAVVVLATCPIFGPIRDKLGIVTRTLFSQHDFSETAILVDFYKSLRNTFDGANLEDVLGMGTNLRQLVWKFRTKTLVLLKLLLLQTRMLWFGYPVERLCTLQYSLVSLVPGLLSTLSDSGSSRLPKIQPKPQRPTELRTTSRESLLAYMGLPLRLFDQGAILQPYMPLQQIDELKGASSFLVGTTNKIFLQQNVLDIVVHTDPASITVAPNADMRSYALFSKDELERAMVLTKEDRRWMDDLTAHVCDGNTWDDIQTTGGMQGGKMEYLGSEDYIRAKFEDYICSALACVKLADYREKKGSPVDDSLLTFNADWLQLFKRTEVYKTWNSSTDSALFDIVAPQHPCTSAPSSMSDIGLRLQENLHALHLEETVGPALNNARESLAPALNNAKEGLTKGLGLGKQALEGVDRWRREGGVAEVQGTIGGWGSFFADKAKEIHTRATSQTNVQANTTGATSNAADMELRER